MNAATKADIIRLTENLRLYKATEFTAMHQLQQLLLQLLKPSLILQTINHRSPIRNFKFYNHSQGSAGMKEDLLNVLFAFSLLISVLYVYNVFVYE